MSIPKRLFPLALVAVPLLLLSACGGDGNGLGDLVTDYPSAGEDRFEETHATVEIEITLPGVGALPVAGARETIELVGPLVVDRSDPQDADGDGLVDIETEMVSMELRGTGSRGEIIVRLSPDRPSMGMVEQQTPGQDVPADSFFDVFLEVEIVDLGLVGFNEEPIRMEAELIEFPPGFLDQYEGALALPTPLLSVDSKEEFALILDALHVPNPPPPGGTPTPAPTATPAPTETPQETPTEEPQAEQARIEQRVGCEHTQPGVQSDLVDLVLAFLVGASPQTQEGGEPPRLVLKVVDPDDPESWAPPLGAQEPIAGATIAATADGPGILEPTQTAVTDDQGAARLRFPINTFGTYEITVNSIQTPAGIGLGLDPTSQLSATFDVGDTCELPPGF